MKRKKGLFPRLAWTGIKNNTKLYKPYILAAVGMIAMFYIIMSLSTGDLVEDMEGGDTAAIVLRLGVYVVGIFAVIFMFYTNSFLIKTRTKEFGLYNILGMSRIHIGRIVAIETIIAAGISIIGGLFAGILFEKLAEMLFLRLLDERADYSFRVDPYACFVTAVVFLGIFLLVMFRSLLRIFKLKTIDLLKSENYGEKPPKAKWFLTLVGAVLLGGAYYLAVAMAAPVQAISMFFVAVIMVIFASYILFISGSVSICRGLQKNKKYYYRSDHFVSLSSMVYRMKRNGAGLASICILSTMVLVMISSTSCLYFGKDASLNGMFPRDIDFRLEFDIDLDQEDTRAAADYYQSQISGRVERAGYSVSDPIDLCVRHVSVKLENGVMQESVDYRNASLKETAKEWNMYFIPIEDYNRFMGTSTVLADDEAICCTYHERYSPDSITTPAGEVYKIREKTGKFLSFDSIASDISKSVLFAVNKMPVFEEKYDVYNTWYYFFDTDCAYDRQYDLIDDIERNLLYPGTVSENCLVGCIGRCKYDERSEFFGMYGGLFFLGIVLSMVFTCALVLILYYKQISEGYEDRARFEIMRKVGMTADDIRKNVNSQMGSVFYMPLVAAVIHLCFASPMVFGMLKLFSVAERSSLILTEVISVIGFTLIYTIVYKITSNSYYRLVT